MASEKHGSSESIQDAKFAPGTETSSIHDGKFQDEAFIEGSEGVTQHDLDTLRHVGDRLPYSAWLVVSVEFAERYVIFRFPSPSVTYSFVYRWTYYGTTNIFNNYIRAPLPKYSTTGAVVIDRANGVAGALGKGQQISFAIRTVRLPPINFFSEGFTFYHSISSSIVSGSMSRRGSEESLQILFGEDTRPS